MDRRNEQSLQVTYDGYSADTLCHKLHLHPQPGTVLDLSRLRHAKDRANCPATLVKMLTVVLQ